MSLFLFLSALYICPLLLGFAGWYSQQPYRDILFYTPFQHLFLIGPVLFFYVKTVFNPKFTFTKKDSLHFIPSALYIVYCMVMVVYDKLILHNYYFLKDGQDRDFDNWYQTVGFISMIIYLIVSIKYYYQYKKAIEEVISNAANFLINWIRNFLIALLSMLVAWLCLAILGSIYGFQYSNSWWYFFCFSIITYYVAIAGYSNAVETKIFFKTNICSNENQVLFLENKQPLYLENIQYQFQEIEIEEPLKQEDNSQLKEWKEKLNIKLLQINYMKIQNLVC